MLLSDLASLGSFVSALAVLASLVFLYFQMRQMTEQVKQTERNQQSLISQNRVERAIDIQLRLCDPAFATVLEKMLHEPEKLSAIECTQFFAWARSSFVNQEEAFAQHRAGLLTESAFGSVQAVLRTMMRSAPYRVAWQRTKGLGLLDDEYCEFVDSILSATPIVTRSPSDEFTAVWKADIAAEFAKAS